MKNNPADNLKGLLLNNRWEVLDKIIKDENGTGGFFSKSYVVLEKTTGRNAFLKALDYSAAFDRQTKQIETLNDMTNAYLYEKRICEICSVGKLDKIVKILDAGEINVYDEIPNVNFLIFEKADNELRKYITLEKGVDFAWVFRSMHNVSVGVKQLHQHMIYHQDIKPSNILLFENNQITKIGDLGRTVTSNGIDSPFKDLAFPGDQSYAPFEVSYNNCGIDAKSRINADLFMLGNLLVFYLTGTNITTAVKQNLRMEHRFENWGGDYNDVSVHLYDSLCEIVKLLYDELAIIEVERNEVKNIILGLCNPDLTKRGFYQRKANISKDLEYLISRLDCIAKRFEYGKKKSLGIWGGKA